MATTSQSQMFGELLMFKKLATDLLVNYSENAKPLTVLKIFMKFLKFSGEAQNGFRHLRDYLYSDLGLALPDKKGMFLTLTYLMLLSLAFTQVATLDGHYKRSTTFFRKPSAEHSRIAIKGRYV